MKKQNLADLCDIVIGRTPARNTPEYWGTGYPWVSISDLKNKFIGYTKEEITQTAIEKIRCRLIPKGTLLFSFKLSIGKMAFASRDLYTNEAIAGLIVKEPKKLSSEYLYYALKVARLLGSNQAAMGKTLNSKSLAEIKIPIPANLDDQTRIATLLSRVEALIATRKDNLRLLDEFLKSTFLEMFGDPVQNEKGWEKKPLSDLGSINRGVSKHRPRNAPQLLGGKYPLIQTGEVSNAGTYIIKYNQTYSEIGYKQSKIWPINTLCITIAANIAQTSILTFKACFPDSVVGFIADDKESNVLYVNFLFVFFQKILEKNAPQAAQKNINLEILRNLKVPAPSVPIQNQFATIVEKVESIKNHYQQNLTELENLYGSLSQKAFKGELDLSRIPLPNALEIAVTEPVPKVQAMVEQNERSMSDLKTRKSVLHELFNAYILERKGMAFSLDEFWQQAELKVQNHMDEDSNPLDLLDYEQAKQWLFDLIENGTLEQDFVEDSNQIELNVKG